MHYKNTILEKKDLLAYFYILIEAFLAYKNYNIGKITNIKMHFRVWALS